MLPPSTNEEAEMYARVATFEGGDLDEIRRLNDERAAEGSSGMPDGVKRVLVLQGDRRLFITFFESRESLEAAEAGFESMGAEIPEDVRGRRLGVETYEVAFDEAT
ncbi:MAG: hypothetical protein H0W16_14720 [Actinobacteria bacterium]|nr:hypothetical protein [Actinomycetota bacterium]